MYRVLLFLCACLLLAGFAWRAVRRHHDTLEWNLLPQAHGELNLPVSVLVPAFNEMAGIVASVRSLLLLEYPRYEILVINDGSTDGTLPALIAHYPDIPVIGVVEPGALAACRASASSFSRLRT